MSATWSKVTDHHDLVAASDAADEMSKRSIKPGPSRIETLLKKLFGSH